ncbi:adenosine deaminase [Stenotrophomonas lactitubi]|nr:adenosine deaminase [Stenotrophomonas lactitubi]
MANEIDDDGALAHVHDRGELHVHLNGAVPTSVVREIMADEATFFPAGFDFERSMTRIAPCDSLAEYLTPWQVLRLFPRKIENLDRLAYAVLASLADNAVRFVELRSSVLYLSGLQSCTPAQAMERLIESTGNAAQRHGIRRGLILTVTRGDYDASNLATLLQAYEDIGRPRDVVGLDLAGDEDTPYSAVLPAMFREAKDRYGFGITIHAGETGRVENVRAAVELFHADRIGHGTAASKDPDLMDLLANRGVCVEVCPISNRLTGAVPHNEAHPLQDFQRRGVPFVICSDNPAIHQRGLADDQAAAMAEGLSVRHMQQQYEMAKRFSFMEGLS